MDTLYRNILKPFPYISEKQNRYASIREKHLQILWATQLLGNPLTTSEGEAISVHSPGIWNHQRGPDFRKADITIGSQRVSGDIEIHFNDQDWKRHGHHKDPAYDQVVLHLSLWKPNQQGPLFTSQHRPIPQAYFENSLVAPLSELPDFLESIPFSPNENPPPGRCSKELFNNLDAHTIHHLITSAAAWRLRSKYETLSASTTLTPLMNGIAYSLGAPDRSQQFLSLFPILVSNKDNSETTLIAYGMKALGYFTPKYMKQWGDSPFYRDLLEASDFIKTPVPKTTQFSASRRPLNHPIRRLVYLIKWICDNSSADLTSQLIALWNHRPSDQMFLKQCLAFLPTYSDPYWESHYLFEVHPSSQKLPLIGLQARRQLLANALFPVLHQYLTKQNDLSKEKELLNLYEQCTESPSRKFDVLQNRLTLFPKTKSLLIHQALYQIDHDFCSRYPASCHGCPFTEHAFAALSDLDCQKYISNTN